MNYRVIYFILFIIIFYIITGKKTYYGKSKYGRGVFCRNIIFPGETIEKSPTIFIDNYDTSLGNYVFKRNNNLHVGFGIASMFNHSDKPNVEWDFSDNREIKFKANRFILPSEELMIHYGMNYWKNKNNKKY